MSHIRYLEMTLTEKRLLIARLTHLISVDEDSMTAVESMLRNASQNGVFENVSFDTPLTENQNY